MGKLFGLSGRIDRRSYFLAGLTLAALKYALDAGAVWLLSQRFWTPVDYLDPFLTRREHALTTPLLILMGLWALPFLWIGVSMTLRRAVDAGISPWHALWFFVPFVNWLAILVIGLLPTQPLTAAAAAEASQPEERVRSAMLGILVGTFMVALGLGVQIVLVKLSPEAGAGYGASLFFGTPFAVGVGAGFFYNRRLPRGPRETAGVAALAVSIAGMATLLFALEGAICVMMALPLAIAAGALGSLLGRHFALEGPRGFLGPAVALSLLPAAGVLEPRGLEPLREIVSSVEIDAPPERVWQHVVSFSELPPPPELIFHTGIAYPLRAHIDGRGVGAVRRCEFSTGAFVEPITAWDEPQRLSFDVAQQPPPMQEWSPYRHVHPPHLDGTMQSKRGEFRLTALPGGRTRLEGSTWYVLHMGPQAYWAPFADALVHQIHLRVLRHVKALSEEG